jgi:alpha 1,3-glucosidase
VAADVGGFFGNPDEEILVRWYQSGAFHPFFRAHAHLDTKRREPYLFDEPTRGYIRDYLRLRYSLLPSWYTAFFHASLSGTPIIRYVCISFENDIPLIAFSCAAQSDLSMLCSLKTLLVLQ